MKNLATLFTTILLLFLFQSAFAQTTPEIEFEFYNSGLSSPVDIANAGDGAKRLFIVEQAGMINIIDSFNVKLNTPFLNISNQVQSGGERGLLGLVFHPDYKNNGFFYVNYTENSSNSTRTRISRFTVDENNANLADPNSEVVLLELNQPYSNHNAGDLNFSPEDGYLYIAMGDGGSGNDPQNLSQNNSCLLGKVLRIDVDGNGEPASASQVTGSCAFYNSFNGNPPNYTVPADNPFINDANVLDEIWSIGWRNPWRFTFDALNGDMWVADVGQNAREEVDFELSGDGGKNYGWKCYEGNKTNMTSGCGPASDYTGAIFEYINPDEGRSITGGCVYRGSEFLNMQGHYVVIDFSSNNLWSIKREENNNIIDTTIISHSSPGFLSISTFGVDEDGEMYAASLGGNIFRIIDISTLPVELSNFSGKHIDSVNKINWTSLSEINSAYYNLERSTDGKTFEKIHNIPISGNSSLRKDYTFDDKYFEPGNNFYRLKIVDLDGSFEFSNSINIKTSASFDLDIYPNPSDGKFTFSFNEKPLSAAVISIFNANGDLVKESAIEAKIQTKDFDFSDLPIGVYVAQIVSDGQVFTKKLIRK